MSFKKFKTERILLASIVVLSLFLFMSAFSREVGTSVSLAEEDSDSSSTSSSESSDDSEDSTSEDSTSEDSDSEESFESSVSSVPSVRRIQSTKSSSEVSQQSVEASEASELSELSEPSEESIKYIEGYGNVVSKNGNIALVKKGEKLFFLIPVEIESQVTLDEQGSVVDTKKSFLNWLLAVFSF
jgi:hypothetical protein